MTSVAPRRPLARGDVVLVHFPFTDLSGQKLRPALIVGRIAGDDVIVAFMTSRRDSTDSMTPADLEVRPGDPEYRMTGLKGAGTIRLNKIATLHRRLIERRLGQIGPRTEHAVARGLRYVFEIEVAGG